MNFSRETTPLIVAQAGHLYKPRSRSTASQPQPQPQLCQRSSRQNRILGGWLILVSASGNTAFRQHSMREQFICRFITA